VRDEEHPVGRKKLGRKAEPDPRRRIRWPRWTGFGNKTVWDLLQLLIVPLMLAALGFWFTAAQDDRQQRLENERAEAERRLAEQRAQDEALQAYLDEMGTLLLEKDLRESDRGSEVRTLARARTLTVLERLDPSRKAAVVRFLDEANLVTKEEGGGPVIALTGADLSGANLQGAELAGADLRTADLKDVNLSEANLFAATLFAADLAGADLSYAEMSYVNLYDADLSDVNLYLANLTEADLSVSDLHGANLRKADLKDTILKGADLSGANLKGAYKESKSGSKQLITNAELAQEKIRTLEGATMPDGSVYD
jgi:uncharacterized protein YjbI with pentapeptide repeats